MPYIQPDSRPDLDLISDKVASTPGELNYQVTTLVRDYWRRHGNYNDGINACIGAFECAKLEFYRRVAGPYEDTTIGRNGDVYLG